MPQPIPDTVSLVQSLSIPRRSAVLTLIVCATAIIVSLGAMAESTPASWVQMEKWGYLPAERIWDGALWALISSTFVHLALWHLGFNVYWLWRFGAAVERQHGSIKFLGFVITVGFLSSGFQLALSGDTGIGASGVVYGLFGLLWRSKEKVPSFAEILGSETAPLFFVWLIACLVATYAGFVNIGNTAHFAGLLFGILVAEWQIRGTHRRWAAGSLVFLSAFSLVAARTNPWSVRWLEHFAMKMHRNHEYEGAALAYERSLKFGADSAWAFHNLALTYLSLGDSTRYVDALTRLRAVAPAVADSLELELNHK